MGPFKVGVPGKASGQNEDSNQGPSCCEATVPTCQFMLKDECYRKRTHADDVYVLTKWVSTIQTVYGMNSRCLALYIWFRITANFSVSESYAFESFSGPETWQHIFMSLKINISSSFILRNSRHQLLVSVCVCVLNDREGPNNGKIINSHPLGWEDKLILKKKKNLFKFTLRYIGAAG